jgi:hypothetical protein
MMGIRRHRTFQRTSPIIPEPGLGMFFAMGCLPHSQIEGIVRCLQMMHRLLAAQEDEREKTYPGFKILFTSGCKDAIKHHGVLETEFLPKPNTPATLVRKVRQMLDR